MDLNKGGNLKNTNDTNTNTNGLDDEGNNEKVEDANDEFSIRLFLKVGQVTGLPKDLASAPHEIELRNDLHKSSHDAKKLAKESGNEWGYFIHLGEKGRLIPGKLREGTPHSWISLEEYLKVQQQDATIQGLMHTHLEEKTVFSDANIGFFLTANDSIYKCMDLQGNYLIMLRTEKTDLPREEIFHEAVNAYRALAREIAWHYVTEHQMDVKEAIDKGLFEAVIEVCKTYNIALYIGTRKKAAKKVV